MSTVELRAFGVAFAVDVGDPWSAAAVERILPPGHVPAASEEVRTRFSLDGDEAAGFRVSQDGERLATGIDRRSAVGVLDAGIRQFVAAHAPEMVFVHAGVVARAGRALVLPGPTFSGKTELVAALVAAGATYFSDEFAVIDAGGLVHPYAKPLSIRARGTREADDVDASDLGAPTGSAPAPVALIAVTRYERDAAWRPQERTPAAGALLLLSHAGQARRDPDRVLAAVQRAAKGARVLEGPRGEAEAAASALLACLEGAAAPA